MEETGETAELRVRENYCCIEDEELLFRHSCQSPAPTGVQDESESICFKISWFNKDYAHTVSGCQQNRADPLPLRPSALTLDFKTLRNVPGFSDLNHLCRDLHSFNDLL